MAKTITKRDVQTVDASQVGTPPTALVPAAAPTTALEAAPRSEAAAAFLQESRAPRRQAMTLPLVTIKHGPGKFQLPSGELADDVKGYPIYFFQTRGFYSDPFMPGQKGKPPDCWADSADDDARPHPTAADPQSETCASCPHSKFGSAPDGQSQACRVRTWLFLLNKDFGNVPLGVLLLPPSSIKPLLGTRFSPGYLGQCEARYGVYEIVWSIFRLKRGGDLHCVVEPEMGAPITDPAVCRKAAGIRNQFIDLMNSMRGRTMDMNTEDEPVTVESEAEAVDEEK